MTEIKYRGPIAENQLKELTQYLIKKGELIEAAYEKVVFFDTSIFPQIGDFITGFSRVSLKEYKQRAVLRIKDGNPSDPERNEIAVEIKKKHSANLVYILNCLGLKFGYYRPVYRQKFLFGNVIISIKTKCVMGSHFEIELSKGTSINDPSITKLLTKFSLVFWSKKKYQLRINAKMEEFPALNVYEAKIWENSD